MPPPPPGGSPPPGGAPPPPGFGAGGQPPPSGGGNGPLIAGLVIAVLAIVGVAVFFLTRDDGPSTGPADTSVVVTVTTTATTGPSATTGTTADTDAPTTTSSADTTEAPDTTDEPDPTVSDDIPPPQDEPDGLGDDPALDELAQDCHAGEMQACDDLFFQSPSDSEYEVYGDTCAGRQPENGGLCTVAFPG